MTPDVRPSRDVVLQQGVIGRSQHEQKHGHRGTVVWLTGLPGSGKSSVAYNAEEHLYRLGYRTVVLDGDNLRQGLCSDLGFSLTDRHENMRRVGEVARLFLDMGVVVFVALVSPIRLARDTVRQMFSHGDYLEVYCRCPVEICRTRDPKGHYAQADSGQIAQFTGVSSPYEEPQDPDLVIDTGTESLDESVNRLTVFLLTHLRATAASPL